MAQKLQNTRKRTVETGKGKISMERRWDGLLPSYNFFVISRFFEGGCTVESESRTSRRSMLIASWRCGSHAHHTHSSQLRCPHRTRQRPRVLFLARSRCLGHHFSAFLCTMTGAALAISAPEHHLVDRYTTLMFNGIRNCHVLMNGAMLKNFNRSDYIEIKHRRRRVSHHGCINPRSISLRQEILRDDCVQVFEFRGDFHRDGNKILDIGGGDGVVTPP